MIEEESVSLILNKKKTFCVELAAPSTNTMASTMQLEFEEAMSDFKTMFPDMEKEVIEAVLRANQGAVDATIDQLLAMSVDNQVRTLFYFCFPSITNTVTNIGRMKNSATNWTNLDPHRIRLL